jgi:cytosine deaminase
LAQETLRHGLQGRVSASHLVSLHSVDNYYFSKLVALMAEAQLNVIANPLTNVLVSGRHDSYPKRRGMTRVPEFMAAGVNVAVGYDCVMDPWYPLGDGDMLDAAYMALHLGQMTSLDGMRACFAAVTENAAKILGLDGYGLAPGCYADMVVLEAADPVEAIRLKATRLHVVRRGKVIAETPAAVARLDLAGRPATVALTRPMPTASSV